MRCARYGTFDSDMSFLQERQQQRAHNLCTNFAIGKCHYGERCKFSHDIQVYLQNKPADLPGSCPFSCLADCPYGTQHAAADCITIFMHH
jgi:hypothetical protein